MCILTWWVDISFTLKNNSSFHIFAILNTMIPFSPHAKFQVVMELVIVLFLPVLEIEASKILNLDKF